MKKETKNEYLYSMLTSTNVLDDTEFRRIMCGTQDNSVKLWDLITNRSKGMENKEHSKDNQEGITKEDLALQLGVSKKTIQTDLHKLSSNSERNTGKLRLGGQCLQVKIDYKSDKNEKGKRYFYTENTLHPLVLQLNVMQLGVLLQSLHQAYLNDISLVSFGIALDVWGQLSAYGKERIRKIFGTQSKEFDEFIDELDDTYNSEHMLTFQTEQELIEEDDLNVRDKLVLAFKGGYVCDIKIKINGEKKVFRKQRIVNRPVKGRNTFVAISLTDDVGGIPLIEEDVLDIKIY